MDELKVGNLVLAALFGLPGYVFILILTKYSFKTARVGAGKTVQLLAAFLFSTVFVCIFQPENFRSIIFSLLCPQPLYDRPGDVLSWFMELNVPKNFLDILFTNKKTPDTATLVSYVFWYTGFAVVASLTLTTLLNIISWYLKFDLSNFVYGVFSFFGYLATRLGKNGSRFVRCLKIKLKKINITRGSLSPEFVNAILEKFKFFSSIFFLFFFLTVIAFVIFAVIVVIILHLLNYIFQGFVFLYYKLMSLFKHPSEEIFENTFQTRLSVPIVEVFTKYEKINKGIFVSFSPKNEEEVGSITIRNVIQYTKDNQRDFFDREHRKVYLFPNSGSRLTMNAESVHDINVTYLKYDDFEWSFKITNLHSIVNQIWYLKIMLDHHKSQLNFRNFNAWVDSRYAPHFFLAILRLLNESYSAYFYTYKLKSHTRVLLKYWQKYKVDLKLRYSSLSPEERNDVDEAKRAFASYLLILRKRFNKLR